MTVETLVGTMKVTSVRTQRDSDIAGKDYKLVYFDPVGETVAGNFMNRRDRPYENYRKLLPEVFERLGVDFGTVRTNWSQYAGCPCGCSPGFRVKHLRLKGGDNVIWVRYRLLKKR